MGLLQNLNVSSTSRTLTLMDYTVISSHKLPLNPSESARYLFLKMPSEMIYFWGPMHFNITLLTAARKNAKKEVVKVKGPRKRKGEGQGKKFRKVFPGSDVSNSCMFSLSIYLTSIQHLFTIKLSKFRPKLLRLQLMKFCGTCTCKENF